MNKTNIKTAFNSRQTCSFHWRHDSIGKKKKQQKNIILYYILYYIIFNYPGIFPDFIQVCCWMSEEKSYNGCGFHSFVLYPARVNMPFTHTSFIGWSIQYFLSSMTPLRVLPVCVVTLCVAPIDLRAPPQRAKAVHAFTLRTICPSSSHTQIPTHSDAGYLQLLLPGTAPWADVGWWSWYSRAREPMGPAWGSPVQSGAESPFALRGGWWAQWGESLCDEV